MGRILLWAALLCACKSPQSSSARILGEDGGTVITPIDSGMGPATGLVEAPAALPPPEEPNTPIEFSQRRARMSTSVFVARIDGLDGVPVTEPPFVSTNIRFSVSDTLAGVVPPSMTTAGGTTSDNTVLAAHGPNIHEHSTYLIFETNGRITAAALMISPDLVSFDGQEAALTDIRDAVAASWGRHL